jgi:tetratricopeptide (TPR) repeat protein
LDEDNLHGASGWSAAKNEMARAQYMAGDFRGAVDTDTETLREIKARALRDTGRYFATASLVCNALRQGGEPAKSREFVDSILVDVRQVVPTAQPPFYLAGCRALAELAMDLPNPPLATLSDAAHTARSAGTLSIANTYGAALVNDAINRGDLAAAESRWTDLAADELKMLDAKEHGPDVVRLLLAHANLELAQGSTVQASQRIDQAAELISARHQPSNADARDVAMMRVRLAFGSGQFAGAAANAQAALDIARSDAIDPKSSAWIGEALLWRGRAEAALGDKVKAKATAQEALPHLRTHMDPGSALIAGALALLAS